MPLSLSEKAMAQARAPYSALPESEHARLRGDGHRTSEDGDVEDNLFDGAAHHGATLEVADDDTLYYGVALGRRRRRHCPRNCQIRKGRGFWITVVCLVVVSVVGAFWLYLNGISWLQRSRKRNVIVMISDGFGPASETMARNYVQQTRGLPVGYQSPLDEILVGSSRTRSSSSLITDSAAGATAFSCALKTYNGAIGVRPDGTPCGTVLEAAKRQRNMATGLVVTSRITHATPAAFSAHTASRDMEDLIAEYQIGNYSLGPVVDLMLGGGRCHFEPGAAHGGPGCRLDGRDLLAEARGAGFRTLGTRAEFDALDPRGSAGGGGSGGGGPGPRLLPLLGTFAPSHMDYEIDRDPAQQPSLAEMTRKALAVLDAATGAADSGGFFLVVEGSRIDMAAHTNDPAAHVRDIIAYWDAVAAAREFVDAHPDTVLISVSDHETGGFSVAKQLGAAYPEYVWRPEALAGATHSIEHISLQLLPGPADAGERYALVRDTVFPRWLGIANATHDEILAVARETADSVRLRQLLSTAISDRAMVGWATHGHSAVDVNLYAYGRDADQLRGNHENTDIGAFVERVLGLDLAAVTSDIKHERTRQDTAPAKDAWLGRRYQYRDLDAQH
ncbi:vacuolar alkaline phosphatase [Coemansia javaensis]|uniref:Alkaline phosphatase n=1 Tax=Coemansia javaensis TaxID=2761396 RepID=A0A9W8HHJ9_9FUNG|nr:vacuolar alkaline phosphatase [Coemansia javaensis]